LKALDIQRRAQESVMDMERKQDEFEDKIDVEKMKIESAEEQSAKRLQVARDKLKLTALKQNTVIPKKK